MYGTPCQPRIYLVVKHVCKNLLNLVEENFALSNPATFTKNISICKMRLQVNVYLSRFCLFVNFIITLIGGAILILLSVRLLVQVVLAKLFDHYKARP